MHVRNKFRTYFRLTGKCATQILKTYAILVKSMDMLTLLWTYQN